MRMPMSGPARDRAGRLVASLRDGRWLTPERLRNYGWIFLSLQLLIWAGWVAAGDGLLDPRGMPVGSDFVNTHAAARLTLAGTPEAAYDLDALHAARSASLDGRPAPLFAWHYPPFYQMLAAPLAALPYAGALAVWLAATMAAYLWTIWRIVPRWQALLLAAAFPAGFVNLMHGQNGFLTTALFGGALLLLRRRPWRSGLLLGLLTVKPHLGVLIPLALALERRWRAIAAAAATLALLCVAALVLLGPETWRAFADSLALSRRLTSEDMIGWHKIQSALAAARVLGGGAEAAFAAQAAAVALGAAAVLATWWRARAPAMRDAALVAAAVLATPYVLDYDLVLLALPIAWMAGEGLRTGFLPWEKTALAAVWALPLVARGLAGLGLPLAPLATAGLLLLVLRRARRVGGGA